MRSGSFSANRASAAAASSGCSWTPGGEAIAAPAAAASRATRDRPSSAGTKIAASARIGALLFPSRAVRTRALPTELRRNSGPSGQLLRPEVDELPVRQLAEGALDCSGQRTLDRTPLEHDELPLLAGLEELRVHALRDDPVLAREALGRGVGSFRRRGDERVDPPEQLLALRLRGRVPEPFGREEAGDAQSPRVPEREVREARQPRLEAVDDVELSPGESRGQVRADADREADPAPPRDRDGRAERDQRRGDAVTQRAPAGGEVCARDSRERGR